LQRKFIGKGCQDVDSLLTTAGAAGEAGAENPRNDNKMEPVLL
jgi:hypothetical protein